MKKTDSRSELKWVILWAVALVALSCVPYIVGMLLTPGGYQFLGLTHNIDDGAVYLSWMRQAADGHFFIRNLFTNEPQAGGQFNILFLMMGLFARVSHIPLIWVFHIFRVGLGVVLIFAVWQFSKLFLEDARQRRLLIPLVGLSSGFGWLIPGTKMPTGSVDVWQPEAITFLSMYLNPLFLAGLVLMIGAFYWLIVAQRTGRMKSAVCAGLHLLVLGNVHTYDVITVGCVWAVYMVAVSIIERKVAWRAIILSAIAAAIAVPSIAYQFHLYQVDEVFKARANSPTPSPAMWAFFFRLWTDSYWRNSWHRNDNTSPSPGARSPLSTLYSPLPPINSVVHNRFRSALCSGRSAAQACDGPAYSVVYSLRLCFICGHCKGAGIAWQVAGGGAGIV